MKLYCKHCKRVQERDMRLLCSKAFMTKRGYKSYCEKTGRNTLLVPYNKTQHPALDE